jgi:hypothetical protein
VNSSACSRVVGSVGDGMDVLARDAEAIRDAIKDAGYLGDRHAEAAARDAEAALDRLLATHRGAVEALEQIAALEYDTASRQRDGILGWIIARAKAALPPSGGQ